MSGAAFISVADAAAELGISDDLVYQLVAAGELPSVVFGRRKLIPRRAIDLVVERALDGFDPDRMAAAVGPSSAASDIGAELANRDPVDVARGERPTGTTGAVDRKQTPRQPTRRTASVVALRR